MERSLRARRREYKKIREYWIVHPDNRLCKVKMKCFHNPYEHATDVHHMAGRGMFTLSDGQQVDLMLYTGLWFPCCRRCHMWVESHPVSARLAGFTVPHTEVELYVRGELKVDKTS